MPDWIQEACRILADFPASERDDVSRELASYLEDLYSDARNHGMDESAAARCALVELHEDAGLGANLRRARKENTMNDRTKHLWLPGMATLLASAGCLAIFQLAGFHAEFRPLWVRGNAYTPNPVYFWMTIYWPWLCALPFFGALGAWWSRRTGGSRWVQAAAGFFSAFVFLAILLIVLVFSFIFGGLLDGVPATSTLFPEFVGALLSWVVIPGIALLLGVLPFLRDNGAGQRRAASS